jgi:hypothetical protein
LDSLLPTTLQCNWTTTSDSQTHRWNHFWSVCIRLQKQKKTSQSLIIIFSSNINFTLLDQIEKKLTRKEIGFAVCLYHFRDHLSNSFAESWSHSKVTDPAYNAMILAWDIYTSYDFKCFFERNEYSNKGLLSWERVWPLLSF